MSNQQQFRNAMARLASSVSVITTNGQAGKGGFTASAVCSVTDSPPTLLVCMNRFSSQRPRFMANGVLCVNILAADQEDFSATFAQPSKADVDERFGSDDWTDATHDLPALHGAVASLATRIVNAVEIGTHHVMFCEVDEIRMSDGTEGLIYFDRTYCRPHPLAAIAAARVA